MPRRAAPALGSAVACALVVVSAAAQAAILRPDTAVAQKTPNNDGDFLETGNPDHQWASQVTTSNATVDGLSATYTAIASVDSGFAGNSHTRIKRAEFTVTFSVDALPGEVWQLQVDVRRRGDIHIVDDGGLGAQGTLGALAGSASGVATVSGGLGLPQHGLFDTVGSHAFDQTNTALLEGVGPTTVQLFFSWLNTVSTNANAAGGDEACIRLGILGSGALNIDCDGLLPSAGVFVDVELLDGPFKGEVTTGGVASSQGRVLFELVDPATGLLVDCAEYSTFLGDDAATVSSSLQNALTFVDHGTEVTRLGATTLELARVSPFGCRVCAVPGPTNCGATGSPPQCAPEASLGFQTVHGIAYSGLGKAQKVPVLGTLGALSLGALLAAAVRRSGPRG